MKRSYNSVGAGDKPKLGYCSSVDVKSRPGSGQSLDSVKVSTDIPAFARPTGVDAISAPAAETPAAARPGGNQGI